MWVAKNMFPLMGMDYTTLIQIHNLHSYYNTSKYFRYIIVSSNWQIQGCVWQWLWGQRRLHLMWRGKEERLVV